MAWSVRSLWTRVKIEGTWVTTGEVRISESLDQLSRVAEFELAERPAAEPAEGDDVLIEWFDFTEGNVYALFGGQINAVEVESQPWSFLVRCTDQLSLLRRVRTSSDLNLTGMTDGEAWKAVMDYVGVAYDDADVADAGYVLGSEEPVKWLVDTPASQIIQELDTVFGMVTETIGNNRVIRFPYDPVPSDGTGSYKTYERAVDIDFRSHRRIHGDRDRIQNVWVVRGPTYSISDACSATVWARAEVGNPQLGRNVRTTTQTFQSDLIQSEDLAGEKVRALMRLTNRLPDDASASLVNDPNVHPGTKITIQDATYGIDANPRHFLVTAVDRQGSGMTLALTAGPAGSEGTVTTGVDKVCSDTHTDLDIPGGGFDFPAFDFPPIDAGLDIDLGDPDLPSIPGGWDLRAGPGGDVGGGGPLGCNPGVPFDVGCWNVYSSDFSILGGVLSVDAFGHGWNVCLPIWDETVAWRITVVCQLADSTNSLHFGVESLTAPTTIGSVDPNAEYQVTLFGDDWTDRSINITAGGNYDSTDFGTAGFLPDTDITVVLEWDPDAAELSCLASQSGGPTASGSVVATAGPAGPATSLLYLFVDGGVGAGSPIASISSLILDVDCQGFGEVLSPAWTEWLGSWSFVGDTEAHNTEETDADAYASGHVFTGTERVRWWGLVDPNASDEVILTFALDDTEGADTGDFCGFQVTIGASPAVDVTTFDGFQETISADLSGGFTFAFDADPTNNLFAFSCNDPSTSAELAAGAYPLGAWPGDMTIHIQHGTAVVCDLDVTDMQIVAG